MHAHASITQVIHPKNPSEFKRRRLKLPSVAMATLLCGLGVSATLIGSSAQAQTDASQVALQHPGWVLVPGAIVRPDCVHQIPNGAGPRIENGRDTGDVSLNGMIIAHYDPCPEDATIRLAQETSKSSVISDSTGSSLVELSYWDDTSLGSNDNIDYLENTLTVPSEPTKNGGMILLYNALQDSTGTYIFAPALQYGTNFGEGGNYWIMTTYFVTPSNTYLSAAKKVNKGDGLGSFIQLYGEKTDGSSYFWEVEVSDGPITSSDQKVLVSTGPHFNFAVSGALTVGNLSSCSEFPASKAVFTVTAVDHGWPDYKQLTPKWVGATYAYGGPACGFSVTPGNKTTLKY
jgi:hypothetical protein